jgi:site-specific recombinase XerD
MRGTPVRAIQELAGHQDLATTKRQIRLEVPEEGIEPY